MSTLATPTQQLQRFIDNGWAGIQHAALQQFIDNGWAATITPTEKTHAKVHFPFDTEPYQLASQEFHQKRFQTVLDGLSKITAFTLHDSGALDVNVQLLVETVYNMTSVIGCRCAILPHDAREGGDVKALVYAPGHGEFQVTAKV